MDHTKTRSVLVTAKKIDPTREVAVTLPQLERGPSTTELKASLL